MAARRSLTLALPVSDPRSARIWALLDGMDPDADASAELRRLICEALDAGARLARIEAKIDALATGGLTAVAQAETIDKTTVDTLLDFGM